SKIIQFSIKNKLIILLGVLALILGGVYSISKLPIDAVPDITNNQVLIITSVPSAGAPDVERLITVPIEQATRNIPGMIEQRSFSRFGLSLVTLVFEDDIDIYWARQQVSERLVTVKSQMPEGMGIPELGPLTTGLGEIYQYVVRPKKGYEGKYSLTELRTMQDWIVRKQLLGTAGVADVSSFGGAVKQFEVSVNPELLKQYDLSVNDIYTALNDNNQNAGGAYIEHGPNVLFIRTEGMVDSLGQIGSIPVKTLSNGMPLLISDIAEIKFGEATKFGATTFNADGEVAGAVVMMLKGENSNQVIADIKAKIATIQETLPEGVVIEPFLDRTKMVDNAIGTVSKNLLEGALIVIFILILFLGNLRAGLVVASVIPLAMLFAFILMHLFGVSGNLMSLGALDFGLLVDGAVIIVEAVLHQLYHSSKKGQHNQLDKTEMNTIVGQVSNKMMGAAAFGQIIILIVYLPILSLTGIEGKMFKPMAQTVSFALIGAFILSITYVPMMSAWVLNRNRVQKETMTDKLMQNLEAFYEPLLMKALKMPKQIIGLTIALFIGAIFLLTTLGGEFIPKLEEGDFAVETRVLSGGSINTTLDATQKASKLLIDRFPEIEKIVTKIGSGEIPTDPMTMDASDLMIILKDKKDWVSANTFDELADTMGKVMSQVPGITSGFQYPVQMRFNELMTGSRQDVSCKIFGENLDSLSKYAALMGNIINQVDGAKDLYTETVTGISQVVVHFNRTAIARYGANIKEVNQVIQSAYAGGVAGKVFEGDRRFDLVVRLNSIQKKDWQQIKNLMVTVGNGKQVPLYELAEVKMEEGPYQIQREDAARRIVVGFNVRGKDVKTVVNEVQEKVKKSIQFPPGYYVVYGGQFENLEHAVSRLQIAVPVALLLILVMLFFAFNNLKHCLLIFSAIPFSAIGGVLALWLRGMPFSISAGVGFIALFGVAVLNGIVLLTEMNKLAMEPNRTIVDIITTATKTRLRPILITAAVASLGFIPMALSSGAGAEVQKPLATVVIGGLLSATLLTLFVLPIFYQLFEKKRLGQTTIAILFCIIGLNATVLQAQQLTVKKPLAKVVEQAMLVSPTLKTTEAQGAYYQALSKSSFDPAKLAFRGELGNVNSSLNDSKYAVEQVFDLPKVYQAQKNLNLSISQNYSYQTVLDQKMIQHAVEQLYIQLQFQVAKGILLSQLDSIYAKQLAAVDARFKAGQDNGLEQLNMQNWVSLHKQFMIKNQNEQLGLQKQFVILLQDPSLLIPAESLIFEPKLLDTVIDAGHPMNLFWKQKLQSAIAETNVAKSKILPQVAVGYTNQSFRMNPNDQNRYNSVNLGLNVPLFRSGLKQKVKASQANETVMMHEKEKALLDLNMQIQKAWSNYQETMDLYQHIQKGLIPNANKMANMANLSFKEGQISYIEWSNAMSQVQQIQMQAIESLALFNLNQSTLYYLLSK
ncbi:MAG: CusA/CzcA family heavy metal efflux RND transporter, partial [Chitinophagaceae bacterium]|nr:CusA/CzcA family heavy metal efflux RND transporter [Chitinophagaceae bacterium]MCF8422518.1 CusA/CzcA family heavy metal efflux RND transporter [Chitinophagaceae bacterium]